MNKSWLRARRALILLALGGATCGLFGTNFGPDGCMYAYNSDYYNLYKVAGDATIQKVSDAVFGKFGKDFDAIVRTPTTTFAQAVWHNWLDARIPDDLPTNAVVQR